MTPVLAFPDTYVPALTPEFVRVDVGDEAVVWPAGRGEPGVLDPVATVMLGVIDGQASVAQLAREVHEEVGISLDVARKQVERIVSLFDRAGILTTSVQHVSAPEAIGTRSPHIHPVSYCIDSESRARGVVSINLRIGKSGVRVACASRRLAKALMAALSDQIVEDEQPLGFLVQKPHGRTRVYRLADRAGVVLASSRSPRAVLGSLGGHLSALLPAAAGAVRLRVGVLACRSGYVVCAPPLAFVPPPSRDALSDRGFGLVDRLSLDLRGDGSATVVEVPWPQLAALPLPNGHVASAPAQRLLAIALHGPSGTPSAAAAVAELARTALSGTPASVLETLAHAVSTAQLVRLPQQRIDELPALVSNAR